MITDETRAAATPGDFAEDRLSYVLPDFTRVSWVSDPARHVWEPRIQRIGAAWAVAHPTLGLPTRRRHVPWQRAATGSTVDTPA